jgi:hypothetical protein
LVEYEQEREREREQKNEVDVRLYNDELKAKKTRHETAASKEAGICPLSAEVSLFFGSHLLTM